MTRLKNIRVFVLLFIFSLAALLSLSIQVIAQNENLTVTTDIDKVNVNEVTPVNITVICGSSDNCNQGDPVKADISIDGAGFSYNDKTDNTGIVEVQVNPTSQGIINVKATKGADTGNASIQAVGPVSTNGTKLPKLNIVADKDSVYMDTYTDITFTVTDPQGSSVPNAYIHLVGAEYTNGYTDDSGQSIITVNPKVQGIITAKVSAAGYGNGSTNISVITAGSSIPINITTNNSGVAVGVPESVTYTVTRLCGTIPGDNCSQNATVPVADAYVTISGVASGAGVTNSNGKSSISVNAGTPGVVTATVTKTGYSQDSTDMNATMTINFEPDKGSKYFRGEPVNLILSNNGGVPIQLGSWLIRNNTVVNNITVENIVHPSSPIGSGNLNPGQSIILVWDQKDTNNTQCGSGDYIAEAGYSFNGVDYNLDTGFKLSSCIGITNPTQQLTSIDGQDINFTTDDMSNLSNTNRTWNVSWNINGIEVSNQTNLRNKSSYFNDSSAQGVYNVTAIATDGCSSMSWQWIWTVSKPSCINVQNYRNMSSYNGQSTTFKTGNLSDISNTWNFTWYINGVQVFDQANVSQSTYINKGSSVGTYNVTAIASEDCNKVIWTWTWAITPKPYKGGVSAGGGGGGGSGGGSGGGGIVSAEPFSNILKFERQDADLKDSAPTPYNFATPEFAIYQVLITGRSNEAGVGMRVEHLKNTSALVSRLPVGTIYANENVWLESKRIKDILIRFRINNSWLSANNIDKGNVQLLRFNDGWKRLITNVTKSDENYTYFEASSPGLSAFAVTGFTSQNNIEMPTDNAANIGPVTTDTPRVTASAASKKSPGFEILLVVAILSTIYILKTRVKWR